MKAVRNVVEAYQSDQNIQPREGCKAIALGSSKESVIMVVTKLPSRSDKHMELVPVSVQYRCEYTQSMARPSAVTIL